jgi:hypothetical protein
VRPDRLDLSSYARVLAEESIIMQVTSGFPGTRNHRWVGALPMIWFRKLPPTIDIPGWGEFRLNTLKQIVFKSFNYQGTWKHGGKTVDLMIHPPKASLKQWSGFLDPIPGRLDTITSNVRSIFVRGWEQIASELRDRGIEPPADPDSFLRHASPSLVRIAAGESDELYLESDRLGHYSSLDLTLGPALEILGVELNG